MTDGNEPAGICTSESGYVGQYSGLTKREYFASKAIQGLADVDATIEEIAKDAVKMADELIKALNNP